ncbi:DUF6243 family protein [Streptomyces sp. NPDC054796]
MSKGRAGNMLGVGGNRSRLSRKELRGGGRDNAAHGPGGGHLDAAAQKRALLRKLKESREEKQSGEESAEKEPRK